MKILVVDDEPAVRLSLKRVLMLQGHEVREAEDGLKGVQLWREWNPDLVLLDVLMPGLTGPAVLQEIGQPKFAKVLLMSAYAGDYDLEKVKAMGADHFLAKPFANIFDVVKVVEAIGSGKNESARSN
ncbi:MAG: response regulator [Bdellovibrionales bacterium]